jgi:hypothetical protein
MAVREFEAGLENIRHAIIEALREIGVTLLPGEISHQPVNPKLLPSEIRLSLAPKGAAFVTSTFTRAEIEASIAEVGHADVRDKVRSLAQKYKKLPHRPQAH